MRKHRARGDAMTAPRITAERIAELKRHYPRGAYSQNRKHHPFGHIASSTIDVNELIDALESAYAELDRLRSAPVAVEVPETEIAALAEEFGVWPDDVRKIASKLQPIPTPRILNDGEIHGTPEALAEICEDAGWLWMHSPIGDKKTLLEFMTDALRSNGGE